MRGRYRVDEEFVKKNSGKKIIEGIIRDLWQLTDVVEEGMNSGKIDSGKKQCVGSELLTDIEGIYEMLELALDKKKFEK